MSLPNFTLHTFFVQISSILSSTGSDPTQSVTSLVTGGAQFAIAPPVTKLERSILKLTRYV